MEIPETEVSPGALLIQGVPGAVFKTLSLLARQQLTPALSMLDAHT